MNPFLSQVAPQAMQQDAYGQTPMMDTTARQMALDAANKQGSQLGQQALGVNKNFMSQVDPVKLGMALRKMNDPFGGTPQGGYAQQAQYMQDASNNPSTPQQMDLYNQGGPAFMSFDNPMTGK